jgi:hypothetical protein
VQRLTLSPVDVVDLIAIAGVAASIALAAALVELGIPGRVKLLGTPGPLLSPSSCAVFASFPLLGSKTDVSNSFFTLLLIGLGQPKKREGGKSL